MQMVLRKALEVRVRQQIEWVPHLHMQWQHAIFPHQIIHCRHVATLQQHATANHDELFGIRHRAHCSRGIHIGKVVILAETLRATADS